ncbi:Zinc transporter ZitB [Klebsiella pneumoniae IS46]|nr:Zinc transporter ZitB [Klebsiella pneumoniae IS46]
MAHSHSHSSVQAPDNSNARRLLWAFIVTAGFMLIEAVGGAISGSLALLADAGHMLTDSAALLFALLAVRFASRPPNARHTFGWLRLTTLAAFSQCYCSGGDHHADCLGGDSALPASAAGSRRDDDGHCSRRSAGQRAGFLDPTSG